MSSSLSKEENEVWLYVSISTNILVIIAVIYFFRSTIKYVRGFGSGVDRYTLMTLTLLCLSSLIRAISLLIIYIQ